MSHVLPPTSMGLQKSGDKIKALRAARGDDGGGRHGGGGGGGKRQKTAHKLRHLEKMPTQYSGPRPT